MTNMPESERQGWAFAMQEARKAGNAQAVKELESIAPYASGTAPELLSHVMIQRKWLDQYGGMVYGRTGGDAEGAAMALSPQYTDGDLQNVDVASQYSMKKLLSTALTVDFSNVRQIGCPVFLFLGRHDHNVSSSVAADWFKQLQAPSKRLVWFEDSAHEVMVEEPGKTLVSLVQYVRPLAEASDTTGTRVPAGSGGAP
jgi:pimeloyl-ACP methyl ester carboxylesterase